ncbi:hypothetical protein LP085_08610 [Achromobacter sp. MY14]|uniref:hypothetical protein n=1 Tax=unclassified Achromobacter TaxID=2626865 RepID=UPI001E2EA91E|nr:hypothetical protein [Achromobacter sp. MY14]MCD0496905.1 hypothetical protein [Achromobacter sp. MY14]
MNSNKQAATRVVARTEALHRLPALRDGPNHIPSHGAFPCEASVGPSEMNDADLLSVLFDLFAGRTTAAFGEGLDWWNETLQCDLAPQAAAGVALSALSKWPFDQRASAPGVKTLQDELLKRARMLIERSPGTIKEAV